MLQKVRSFWLRSYQSDKQAFYFELVSFVFTVGASLTLAITAVNPDMRYIYPAFFVGATTQYYASYRRAAAWVMILTGWLTSVNVFGYAVAMGWW